MNRRFKIAIGVVSLAFGIFIAGASALFSGPYQEDQVMRVSGAFAEYYELNHWAPRSETVRFIRLRDGRTYSIGSITHPAFRKDAFLADVKAGDLITLIVKKDQRGQPDVLAIYKGDRAYMDYEKAQSARRTNRAVGIVLGAAFTAASLGALFAIRSRRR